MGDIFLILALLHGAILSTVVILERRNPSASLAWIVTAFFLPGAGAFLYWVLGRRKVRRRRRWRSRYLEQLASLVPPKSSDVDLLGHAQRTRLIRLAQRVTGSLAVGGNRLKLLKNALESYAAILTCIGSARHHVHAEYYIFRSDPTGRTFATALERAARRGVEVRVLLDAVGSASTDLNVFAGLKSAGGQVQLFAPARIGRSRRLNFRNHRKIVVVDGHTAFAGGINIGDEYLGKDERLGPWRDTHLLVNGPAARYVQQTFLEDWCFASGQVVDGIDYLRDVPPAGDAVVQVVPSGPDLEWRALHQTLFRAIAASTEKVLITSPYFIPDETMMDALTSAALAGVDVKLLAPTRSDLPVVLAAGRSYYRELLEAGVEIHEFLGGFIHAKTFVIDNWAASVGSANMDIRSFRLNYEINLLVYDPLFAGELETQFMRDLRRARQVTLEEHVHRPLSTRLVEGTARVFSPLL